MLISLGKYLNHLARPNVTTALNPAASGRFPVKNLYDGTPITYMQFGAVPGGGIDGGTLNRTGVIHLSLLKNPGAEQLLLGWKKGGTVVASTDEAFAGTRSWKITADGFLYQDLLSRSGELARISGATLGDGASAEAFFGVQNIDTGLALDSSGNWVAPDQEIGTGVQKVAGVKKLGATTDDSDWTETSINFRVQPYSATLKHLTKLRVVASCDGSGIGFVDELIVVPGTDAVYVGGFNFPANMLVKLYSSETGAFGGEEVLRFTLNPFQPSFYQWLSTGPILTRYMKFVLEGVRERLFLPAMGELILTQMEELEVSSRYSSALRAAWVGAEKAKTPAQADKALATPSRPSRSASLPFRWFQESHWEQAREWFVNRCRGEGEEILVTMPEVDAQAIVFGRLQGPRGFTLSNPDVRDSDVIKIQEKEFFKPPKGEEL